MGYVAELDGLRALAIVLVLAFHGGWSWMSGGYVGVSFFFTLSGFLVTGLLLDEFEQHGRIDIRRFLLRRMRRLLPASLACLSAVAVLGTFGAFGSQPDLGRDLIGATTQLANWFALAGDTSYAEQVLGARSPLDHFWSLSIEEQFYWTWPFAVGFVVKRAQIVTSVVIATVVAFAVAIWIAKAFGPDAAYWATPARAGEVLVGASLAVFIRRERPLATSVTGTIGVIGLSIVLWAAITWPARGGPAYNGWLPFFAIASAALIFGAQRGDRSSTLRSVLRMPPLVGLGRISYGVYLYHWPVFLLVDRHLGHSVTGNASRFATQVIITVAIALISYRWLERPIRNGVGRERTVAAACATATAAVLAVAALGSFGPADRFANPPLAVGQLEPVDSIDPLGPLEPEVPTTSDRSASTTAEVSPPLPNTDGAAPVRSDDRPVPTDVQLETIPTRPVRILVFGDSTAWTLGDGLEAWAVNNPSLAQVDVAASPGCGIITDGRIAEWDRYDDSDGLVAKCLTLHENLPRIMAATSPDVVLIMVTASDLLDRVWVEAEGPSSIFDAEFRTRATARYSDFSRGLSRTGATTVWIKAPTPQVGSEQLLDPRRTEALHGIIDEAVAGLAYRSAESIDLAAWYGASGMDDRVARADGLHFELDAAWEISERLIGPALVNLALRAATS
jgi:peptidoglycan/LPS O-acetylase OafA/YrhL/lysophospholipase L1-like esterase